MHATLFLMNLIFCDKFSAISETIGILHLPLIWNEKALKCSRLALVVRGKAGAQADVCACR